MVSLEVLPTIFPIFFACRVFKIWQNDIVLWSSGSIPTQNLLGNTSFTTVLPIALLKWYNNFVFPVYFIIWLFVVQKFDIKQKRTFLKRTQIDNLSEKDFYIGASVNVFSRQLFIRDFGDNFTCSKLDKSLEKYL